ncbi:uncharacterized protein LOC129716623 [Wyeomyia smithii]|uniref:uncharacterized protein LOC129716623 n=1 Tax=Wyeomyia smithii TaxID=174621 RepID=UPI002467EB65|nr:uncharacterized protein LOC129716623 [Wyeomyia smithii]
MTFKIVQTIEGGESCLSIVPSGWEVDGILHWPKKHKVVKLSLQEDSLPADNWQRINCIKKRQLQTYEEACEELNKMENKSDTEMDEVSTTRLPDKRRQQLTTNTRTIANVDLNAYAEQQTADFSSTTTNSKDEIFVLNNERMGTGLSLEPIVLSESADSITQNPAQVVYLQPEMVHDNATDSVVATAVLQNLNLILANQSEIMQVIQSKLSK